MARRSRSFRRGAKDYVWSAVLTQSDAVAAGTTESLNIVEAADWVGAAGSDRATLLRIRGSVSFIQTTVLAVATTLRWGILRLNVGEAVPDLNSVVTYIDEDILAYGVIQGLQNVAGTADDVLQFPIEIDVKAKRKLETNTLVAFVVRATGNDFLYSATMRGLVNRI